MRAPPILTALGLSLGVAFAAGASATDLLQIYDRSLTADPLWQQAIANQLAAREVRTQALIGLLPLDVSANKSWQAVGSTSLNTPANAALVLQVNLFSWNSWVALKTANATVAQAEANYQAAAQNLVARVTSQYFAVLNAQDVLTAEESALDSVQRQLDQAQQRYANGLIAITDVQTAQAERDSTAAAVIADKRALATQQDLLRTITDESYASLAAPSDTMPLLTPQPASEDDWVHTAMDQNAALTASRLGADIAHDNLLTAYGGHLPTVSIGVSRAWALEHGNFATPEQFVGSGLEPPNTGDLIWQAAISVPLFSGGAVSSHVRQAHYNWDAAKAGLEYTSRQTEEQTRDAYQGVVSQVAQVRALRAAVESNRVALEATEAGYAAGTKSVVDVLTARQLLVQAETSYAAAKYAYLNDIVALRLAAGTLDRSTVVQINGWLAGAAPLLPATPGSPGAPGAAPDGAVPSPLTPLPGQPPVPPLPRVPGAGTGARVTRPLPIPALDQDVRADAALTGPAPADR